MQIKELMKTPYVVDKDISLADAAKIMSEKNIGGLLFVIRGKVKGIITEGDLLRNYGKNKKISQIMSKNVITVSAEDNIEDCLKVMKENKVKRLPVIDEKKRLVGIISMSDIAVNAEKLDGEFFFS